MAIGLLVDRFFNVLIIWAREHLATSEVHHYGNVSVMYWRRLPNAHWGSQMRSKFLKSTITFPIFSLSVKQANTRILPQLQAPQKLKYFSFLFLFLIFPNLSWTAVCTYGPWRGGRNQARTHIEDSRIEWDCRMSPPGHCQPDTIKVFEVLVTIPKLSL